MANEKWRPSDWDERRAEFSEFIGGGVAENNAALEDFEAGADAMLEALFQLAKESPTDMFIIDSKEHFL